MNGYYPLRDFDVPDTITVERPAIDIDGTKQPTQLST